MPAILALDRDFTWRVRYSLVGVTLIDLGADEQVYSPSSSNQSYIYLRYMH